MSGVTVYQVMDGEIRYMPTSFAISPRPVNLQMVSFYEQMDICFGRKAVAYDPICHANEGTQVDRFL
jgi:6-phosphofructokinase 1